MERAPKRDGSATGAAAVAPGPPTPHSALQIAQEGNILIRLERDGRETVCAQLAGSWLEYDARRRAWILFQDGADVDILLGATSDGREIEAAIASRLAVVA